MERRELINNLIEEKYSNLYMIYGRETLLIDEIYEYISKIIDPGLSDFNFSVIDGKETSLEQIISAIETLPLMSERRVVVVKDFELFKGKKKNFTDEDEELLLNYLLNLPKSTILAFINYGEVDKKRKLYKKINDIGISCEMKKMDDMSLLSWCRELFESNKIISSNSSITYFIEVSGYRDKNSEITLSDLKNEIEKISSYLGTGGKLDNKVINELLRNKVENDIFMLIDCISSKNSRRALKIFNDMIDSGESVLSIFAMLSRQFNTMIHIKTLTDKKLPNNIIKDTLNIHPYVLNKNVKQLKNFTDNKMVEIMNYIVDSDFRIKQGKINENLALEIFIAKFC